jgi:hypothetical protein
MMVQILTVMHVIDNRRPIEHLVDHVAAEQNIVLAFD